MAPTLHTDVLIVGAGFAGVATAFHLSRQSRQTILVIDKEEVPGFHASGRNASLLLQSTHSPAIRNTTLASRKAFEDIREEIAYRSIGSLLLGQREQLEPLRDPRIESHFLGAAEVALRVPALEGYRVDAAMLTPSDGLIDIGLLLRYYIEQARTQGVEFHLDCPVTKIEPGRPFQVLAGDALIKAGIVVNAAGAWASEVAALAGASSRPLCPYKRHLFVLDNPPSPRASLPFVWSLHHNFYFRPESGGYLFSLCDEEVTPTLEPTVNEDIHDLLAELIWKHLPGFREAVQRTAWSCFRTKTPDDHFLIGPDPSREGFFWVAGLGGHGMGASWEIGRLAASSILDPESSFETPFYPGREFPAD